MEINVKHFTNLSTLNAELTATINAIKASVQNPLECFETETVKEMITLNNEIMDKLESKFADVRMVVAEIEDTLTMELKNRKGAERLW